MDARSRLLKIMETQGAKNNPPPVSLAVVVSVPPNLIIQTGNIQITNASILIADYLLNTYSRQINIPVTTATGNTDTQVVGNNGSHSHNILESGLKGQINFTDTLSVGDQLAVQETADGQKYIILARVVSLDG